jgi:alanyl-tRNA synthetase
MTKKLYHEDPYLQEFSSEVVEEKQVNGKPAVVLKQTAFYPTSGGQPHDLGTLNAIAVVDVIEDETHRIVHLLEEPLKGRRVTGLIDWQRRLDHMQQHTGQHVLSQVFSNKFEAETISFHLGEESATIDLDKSGLGHDAINGVEIFANRIIFENRSVVAHTVGKSELDRFPLRKPPAVEDRIRIIEVKDFDYSACGGTHCSRTGEIGILKISRYEHYKGGTRIHFVCGLRALKDYQRKSEIIKHLTTSMSSSEGELHQNIQKFQENFKFLRLEYENLKKQVLDNEAQVLCAERKKIGDIYMVKRLFENRDQKELKILAKKILNAATATVILFGAKSEGKASLLFQRSEELPFDMGQLMKKACTVIKGRGGGRPQQAQGGGPDVDNLANALQDAENTLFERRKKWAVAD